MSAGTTASVEASCSYCGRENPERLLACTGCGTPLSAETTLPITGPKKKSMFMAVGLAAVFGPLGLFYSNVSGGIWLIAVAVAKAILVRNSGTTEALISFFGFRVICVALAIRGMSRLDGESGSASDAGELLDQAARLESIDRTKAILAYEEIVSRFAGTAASREARRNIQVLKQHVNSNSIPPHMPTEAR
jgi:hypothetical protein